MPYNQGYTDSAYEWGMAMSPSYWWNVTGASARAGILSSLLIIAIAAIAATGALAVERMVVVELFTHTA